MRLTLLPSSPLEAGLKLRLAGPTPPMPAKGYADVPPQPASHGCARLPLVEAKLVYDFVSIGTPVRVI